MLRLVTNEVMFVVELS